jgi:LytS/YehU family sensor histidine kinase
MHEDVDAADRMITHLGDLVRAAYDTSDQLLIPLQSELKWLQDYAAMMVARYRGQLIFDLDVDPGLLELQVPRLLLQPVVENAFRHGLGDGRGRLSVAVRRAATHLEYIISDDGVGFVGSPPPGTGLSNVSRRLQLLYADDHTLSVAEGSSRGTVVTIRFPVRE